MRKALFVMAAAVVALFAFGASTASAAPTRAEGAHTAATYRGSAVADVGAQAFCHYKVNHKGGIKVRVQPRNDAKVVGSLANGTRFDALCNNISRNTDAYTDCVRPFSTLWKPVSNGYVKTKCLARI